MTVLCNLDHGHLWIVRAREWVSFSSSMIEPVNCLLTQNVEITKRVVEIAAQTQRRSKPNWASWLESKTKILPENSQLYKPVMSKFLSVPRKWFLARQLAQHGAYKRRAMTRFDWYFGGCGNASAGISVGVAWCVTTLPQLCTANHKANYPAHWCPNHRRHKWTSVKLSRQWFAPGRRRVVHWRRILKLIREFLSSAITTWPRYVPMNSHIRVR